MAVKTLPKNESVFNRRESISSQLLPAIGCSI